MTKIGLLVDELRVARWQAEALTSLSPEFEIVVYNCTNSRASRRSLKHALYYALNLACLRTPITRSTRLPETLKIVDQLNFAADYEGDWQRLPQPLLEKIAADHPALILKFGMGLLRVPAASELPIQILSYHHGDPRLFRGRPAGFHELLMGRTTVGQIVQILSNKLDAGKIVAFGETKAHAHSYRRTMIEAYSCSPRLLKSAISNALSGETVATEATGNVYRLPSNSLVLRFLARQLQCLIQHWIYGALFEKHWQVAEASLPTNWQAAPFPELPDQTNWRVVRCPPNYRFLADPFYHPQGLGLLVEALNRSTNTGEILLLSPTSRTRLTKGGSGHYSYPATFTVGGRNFIVPEMSEWSPAKLYRLSEAKLEEIDELDVPGRPHLIDPTLFVSDDGVFLFANDDRDGSSVLRLWRSDSLHGPFAEHVSSPVRISPAGSRMAGSIYAATDGTRLRFGQDLTQNYGDGIFVFQIDVISGTEYRERLLGEMRFAGVCGPHTLNFQNGSVVFDYYSNRFAPLAGIRRLWSRARRKPQLKR